MKKYINVNFTWLRLELKKVEEEVVSKQNETHLEKYLGESEKAGMKCGM